MVRLAFGCGTIDAMLEGGTEAGCLSLLYGESGTGKTTLCLLLAVEVARHGKKVIYIDTEGVSMERLKQIAGDDFDAIVKNILFSNICSFDEQERMVEKAIKLAQSDIDIGMLVVDSISMHYRLTSREEDRGERRSLAGQSAKLTNVAREKALPVVVTSQVYTDVETGTFEALGGHALHHNAKIIVRIDKTGTGRRRAVLMKHRSLPEGMTAEFQLTSNGISC
ncbi:MAG: DNA repair and recombination protein RadB [Euryarchaeota archaeon]|nr:DNA repair and recombination protein RadB [Euryarchaeota archaeon]